MAKKNKVLSETESPVTMHWAITSQLTPHRLAYRINQECDWALKRLKNLIAESKVSKNGFALYHYQQFENHPEFYLIALQEDKNTLVKGLKKFDYLIQVRMRDEGIRWNSMAMLNAIRGTEEILGIFEINVDINNEV